MYNNSVHLNIKSIFLTNYFKPLFQNGVSKLWINLGMKLNAILLQSDKQEITSTVYYKEKKIS